MSENKEPDWSAKLAWENELLARQFEPMIRATEVMRRQMEPIIRAQEVMRRQMEPIIRATEAMRRQMEPIVSADHALQLQMKSIIKATELFTRGGSWPVPPFQQELMRTVSAAMGGLMSSGPVAHQRTASLTASPVMAATAAVTVSGNLALPKMRVAGQGAVQEPARRVAERDIGYILALVLVAFGTGLLLGLPEADRATVGYDLGVIGVMLPIAILIWTSWNKSK